MIRHPRRTLPASLVALVLLAAAVLIAVSCIQLLTGQHQWLSFSAMTQYGSTLAWNQPATLAMAAAVAVLGLALLLAALTPGSPTVLPLASSDERPVTGVTRSSLNTVLSSAAASADGVETAIVRVRGRAVTATVRTPLNEPGALAQQVHSAISERLEDVTLARPRRIKVRVATTWSP
ncbi:MAG: hypothetical protein JF887_00360 [Candidatus Dormibacteraeota bacterium]|uniref:DUF6286 domain-containing protein n=1 Tax=Candidatus Amunia macphersoniae TaxID=3127014 RepID=A0A934KHI0_9BACT|nr:hypothetical protein [Candidatus Dormibacteraeota bacterium]